MRSSDCTDRYQPGHEVAPPPPTTTTCPDPNQALGATGNCAPLTQTPEAPVPKGVPRNLLPEGIFEGPTTSPQQQGLTPEVAPPTAPEDDNDDETQSRITGDESPTGTCNPVPIGPFCTPCDPSDDNPECIPVSQCIPPECNPPKETEDEEPLVPPITGPLGETAPQVAPPTAEDGSGQPPNQPVCPEGQVLDEETGVCVPIECPEGQVLDEETGICFRKASPLDAAQEQEAAEDQPQEVEEPEETAADELEVQQTDEEQPTEESN